MDMIYKYLYHTPAGFDDLLMNSDGKFLTGLWFAGSKDAAKHIFACETKDLPIFRKAAKWLDLYFAGQNPDFVPKYQINHLTPFREKVLNILQSIPFGETLTYGDIARIIAEQDGLQKMSSQAVGSAVGWNPICIIIPCHRVIGADGSLTGYGGGLKNKAALLAHEKNS